MKANFRFGMRHVLFVAAIMFLSTSVIASAGSNPFVGKKITDVVEGDVKYLTKDEAVSVMSGHTVVAESIPSVKNGKYLLRTYNQDGSFAISSHKKSDDSKVFSAKGKWWMQDDGIYCVEITKKNKQWCNKKIVRVEDTYLNVKTDDDVVFASWKIKQ